MTSTLRLEKITPDNIYAALGIRICGSDSARRARPAEARRSANYSCNRTAPVTDLVSS
ncbi:hypothetical protein [Streptomyces sp. NPDC002851]